MNMIVLKMILIGDNLPSVSCLFLDSSYGFFFRSALAVFYMVNHARAIVFLLEVLFP